MTKDNGFAPSPHVGSAAPTARSEESLITDSKPIGGTLISATFTMSRKQWEILRSHLQEARDRDPDEHVALRVVRDIYKILNGADAVASEAPISADGADQ